jgi:hypothetical protein
MKMPMKFLRSSIIPLNLALACACGFIASQSAQATPYATSLTNNSGVVSFRLNETTGTNDSVKVIINASTFVLQAPANNTNNHLLRGLIVTNLGVSGLTTVQIQHLGDNIITTNGPAVAFNSPRGVVVNRNASSPYFGRVYVANSAAGTKGDGLFAYNADLSDALGQGAVAKTGGYTGFASSTTFSPYRVSVGADDKVYVCDTSDPTGNLIYLDPNLSAFNYALMQLSPNGAGVVSAASPLGTNNHGSLIGAITTGSQANGNLVLYTMDEDLSYNNPTSSAPSDRNSLWRYNIGSGTFPYSNAPNAKLMTPFIRTSQSQNQDLAVHPTLGYVYVVQRRSNGLQWDLYVVDPANPISSDTYSNAQGGYFWTSQYESTAEGWSDDLLRECNGVTVSSDGSLLACIVAADNTNIVNSGLGINVTNYANDIIILPLTNGIPDLPHRTVFSGHSVLGPTSLGRGLAFDAANNLYVVSSGQAILQSVTLGQTAIAATRSDGTFNLITPTNGVTASASTSFASETGPTPGVFTLTRTANGFGSQLTVFFSFGGTATAGSDYSSSATGSVVFQPGDLSTNLTITPVDDSAPELTETVILTISGSTNYYVTGNPAVLTIEDNDAVTVDISTTQGTMYERVTNDYATFTLTRRGATNAGTFTVNLSYAGTATSNVDYVATQTVDINAGEVRKTFTISPLDDGLVEGPETVIANVASGTGYAIGTNGATATIVDDDLPAETVLYSADFSNPDAATNWVVHFGSRNGIDDFSANFNFDYAGAGIPLAPHSVADTHGLYLTVNKSEATPLGGAGISVYPTNHVFGGDYALRFDMYLIMNNGVSTTEYADFGINHSGNETNWFRNSTDGAIGTSYDGLWYAVEADGADLGVGSGLGDYVLNSAPAITNAGIAGPTNLRIEYATDFTSVFKSPPWSPGLLAGVPANQDGTATPVWADVEVQQVGGVVTLIINRTPIMSYTNTTPYNSGTIMLGYNDAFDSVGAGAAVIYANVRVVSLATPTIHISNISLINAGATVQIDFTGSATDTVSSFTLQSAGLVTGTYGDVSSTITQLGSGSFRAVRAAAGSAQFYRIRHL